MFPTEFLRPRLALVDERIGFRGERCLPVWIQSAEEDNVDKLCPAYVF
jgi:hypothetical protein